MNLRNQKGINMITLSVAVLILVIITSILVYSSRDGIKVRNLKDLYNDIELLNNKVATYYAQNGDIPKSAKYEALEFLNLADYNELNPNNGNDFYVIDLKSMEGITLNYGRDYDRVSKDVTVTSGYEDIYIINEQSHTIYYPRGIDVQGVKHFTYIEDWKKVELSVVPIYTAEQLAKVGSGETLKINGENYTFSLEGNYLLKNDIDLNSICYKVDGTTQNDKSWTPIGSESNPFTGIFYGNGHKLTNLYINTTAGNQGLFGTNNGTIQDLTVDGKFTAISSQIGGISAENNTNGTILNCISSIQISAKNYVAGICSLNLGNIFECKNFGQVNSNVEITGDGKTAGIVADNRGLVSKCYNEGKIMANGSDTGGIVGANRNTISLSYNNADVFAGYGATGGIAGWNTGSSSKIENCYNLKNVTCPDSRTCGIVGTASGYISNCYSIGNISSSGKAITKGGTLSNCYYLSTLSTTDENATPKTSDEMKQQTFVDLLNNGQENAPWTMDTKGINYGFPVLKWQNLEK